MSRRILVLGFWALLVGLPACAPKSYTAPSSPGERIFRSKCSACHRLPKADQDKNWRQVLQRHAKRVKLSEQQRAALLHFLQRAHRIDRGNNRAGLGVNSA